jgi:peptidoglycan/LPS O-acetylase OafA/YrhL
LSLSPQTEAVRAEDGFAIQLAGEVRKSHIIGLDGVRTAAILIVVVSHYSHVDWGALGVELFFVLSGFLITTLLLRESDKNSGTISLRSFYQRRARRIFPAYYVSWILAVIAFVVAGSPPSRGKLLATFFYFTNYYQTLINPVNGFMVYSWSLAVEEQFYLIWPLLFKWLIKDPVKLAKVTLCVVVACAIWRFVFLLFSKNAAYVYNAFECRADQLFIGCLLAISINRQWLAPVFAALCKSQWLLPVTATLLALSFFFLANRSIGPTMDALLSAALIVQFIWFARAPYVWAWLESPFTRYGAKISYATYLYHTLAHNTVAKFLPSSRLLQGLLGAVLVVIAAQLSYVFIERPFLRGKRAPV